MIISTECTGCALCSGVCKFGAIQMIQNEEGFLNPTVDIEKCINCGLCKKMCPQNTEEDFNLKKNITVYAAVSKDKEALVQSSSGGVFFVLAQKVIEMGGIVCGCVMDLDHKVLHSFAENRQDLENMRGSKYVQSDTSHLYSHLRAELNTGRMVLFSGTPCQVAGVYRFLGKDYNNLLTIDLICHGVPSPKIMNAYIDYEEKKRGIKIRNMKFRSKAKENHSFMMEIESENSSKIYLPHVESWYYYYFLKGTMYRECCYSCRYAAPDRIADISLGDFWGAEKYFPLDTSKGISVVLINSLKGAKAFAAVKQNFVYMESDIHLAKQQNKQLQQPSEKPKDRDCLMELIRRNAVDKIEQKYKKDVRIVRIKYYVKYLLNAGKKRK